MGASIFGSLHDTYFMGLALRQGYEGYAAGEIPIGAVVVNSMGTVMAQAHNQVEKFCTQRAHAEMIVLEQAAAMGKNWRLDGCWLYVTLEPCSMCMGLAQLSRLAGVIYGASSPLWGFRLDNTDFFQLYKRDALVTVGGIEEKKAEHMLKTFFKERRTKASG